MGIFFPHHSSSQGQTRTTWFLSPQFSHCFPPLCPLTLPGDRIKLTRERLAQSRRSSLPRRSLRPLIRQISAKVTDTRVQKCCCAFVTPGPAAFFFTPHTRRKQLTSYTSICFTLSACSSRKKLKFPDVSTQWEKHASYESDSSQRGAENRSFS